MQRTALAIALLACPAVVHAAPVGVVEAPCTGVQGWAFDATDPSQFIAVHLYFDGPAGDPAAVSIAVTADRSLRAGCNGDECSHGFFADLPLSRFTNQPQQVYAYGIALMGDNPQLANSPAQYTCPPLPIVMGTKRHIVSPPVLEAWKFSTYFDMLKVADLDLAAVPVGPAIDAAPVLALAEGTQAPLWLIDQGFRREVAPDIANAWRFSLANATPIAQAELAALPEGTPITTRPVLAQGSGAAVYLLDQRQCSEGDPDPACAAPDDTSSDTDDPSDTDTSSDPSTTAPDDDTADGSGSFSTTSTSDASGDLPTSAVVITTGEPPAATDADADTSADGCGCRATSTPSLWWLGLVIGLGWRRRPCTD